MSGPAPFGFCREGDRLVPNPDEAPVREVTLTKDLMVGLTEVTFDFVRAQRTISAYTSLGVSRRP